MKYPIAEIFYSIQGEGLFQGTSMLFVRMAGCSVGKIDRASNLAEGRAPYIANCCTVDGRSFKCDTQYSTSAILTVEDILKELPINAQHVCITGGEPFDRDLSPLVGLFVECGVQVHIETSGTKSIPFLITSSPKIWITVSPKLGCLEESLFRADEIKLLVDEKFDSTFIEVYLCKYKQAILWLQPVNQEHAIIDTNLQRCIELVKKYPACRLSMQSHKIWSVR